MLVFFGWTAAEAILLYVKLVVILGTQKIESKFVLKAALATWCKSVSILVTYNTFHHLGTQGFRAYFFYCGVSIVTILKCIIYAVVPLVIVAISAGAGHDYYINPF